MKITVEEAYERMLKEQKRLGSLRLKKEARQLNKEILAVLSKIQQWCEKNGTSFEVNDPKGEVPAIKYNPKNNGARLGLRSSLLRPQRR